MQKNERKHTRYYIHFETKPSFQELDVFFEKCVEYEPVLATSYYVVIDPDTAPISFPDFARQCFRRYRFVILPVGKQIYRYGETNYVKTDLPPEMQ